MPESYEEDLLCSNCRRKTPHVFSDSNHERDTYYNFAECSMCGAVKMEHGDKHGAPFHKIPVQYVVGLVFDETMERVVLVRKNRPKWQARKLNGVGGGWDEGESREEAVRREFREEAGVDIEKWTFFAASTGRERAHFVHFFWAVCDVAQVRTMTDEVIEVHRVSDLDPSQLVRGVLWRVWFVRDGGYKPVETVDTLFE